jgi:hypothetical protein
VGGALVTPESADQRTPDEHVPVLGVFHDATRRRKVSVLPLAGAATDRIITEADMLR